VHAEPLAVLEIYGTALRVTPKSGREVIHAGVGALRCYSPAPALLGTLNQTGA